ncbi:hypothetical protein D9611_006136 [Ephemerocybe angulata]|uniref:Endo-1,4-beta-xylanase n=1 Tax=Ephemerocybe angulata TaxID=980116 RepID=A0A8H5CFU8_9AGAR|nr:hypothetical protein D9611_006136 [Tulosesus angulatus]
MWIFYGPSPPSNALELSDIAQDIPRIQVDMVTFKSLFFAVSAAVCALAAPGTNLTARAGTPSAEGTHDGFFYSWWTDNGAQATYTNGPKGQYTGVTAETWWEGRDGTPVLWTGKSVDIVFKDDELTPSSRVITYGGTYSYNGNSYLAVYGWTRNPLIEYYIVDNFGTYNPSSGAQNKGSVTVDGAVYDILVSTRTNQPSIDGTKTFQQFWSVRRNKRTGGTVDVGAHFRAWSNAGLKLGTDHYYQIVACEGYQSSGNCNITVQDTTGGGATTTTTQMWRAGVYGPNLLPVRYMHGDEPMAFDDGEASSPTNRS